MGILATSGNPNTSPSALGQQSLDLTRQSGDMSIYGSAFQGLSNTAAYLYQSKVAGNNAAIMARNAAAATSAGEYAEGVSRIRTSQKVAQQQVGYAGSNIDVGSGTPQAVKRGTEGVGEAEALAIRYNAAREAYAYQSEASQARAQQRLSQMGAIQSLAAGAGQTYASYISASSALRSREAQFRQYGVTT